MATYAKSALMKKRFLCLLILVTGLTQLFAQSQKSSLLWEISGKGLTSPSYLFGTFHQMCKGDFSISPVLKSKLKSTKQFYGELKMDDFASMRQDMTRRMIMKDTTIESLMGASDYKAVSDSFQKITGVPYAMFNQFRPFISVSMLVMHAVSCTETVQPETEFVKLAQEYKLTILGLETMEDQMRVVDKEPLDSQAAGLKKMLLNFDSVKNGMKEMIAIYKKRNVDSMASMINKAGMGSDFEKTLVIDRNKKWIPLIEKAIRQKPSFFAVGAGHLGGQEGVIRLLRKQGYRVTPVNY